MQVYSLFDRKLKQFGQLVVIQNDESVKRSILDNVVGSNSLVEKYAEDFDIVHLGSFDQDTGVLAGSTPRLVENVAQVIRPAVAGQEVRDAVR